MKLRRRHPFTPIVVLTSTIAVAAAVAGAWLILRINLDDPATYPLLTALVAVMATLVASLGWAVAGWIAHRNARVLHTINLIGTRFSQPLFSQQLSRFNRQFGDGAEPRIDSATVKRLGDSNVEADHDAVQSIKYILNYFEFIASGVLAGELDLGIVEDTIRGSYVHYYGKCEPYIDDLRRRNPRTLSNYHRLQAHFRAGSAPVRLTPPHITPA